MLLVYRTRSSSGGVYGALSGGWPWAPLFSLNLAPRIQLACGWFLPHLQAPMLSQDMTFDLFFHRIGYDWKKVDSQQPFLGVPIEQVNYPHRPQVNGDDQALRPCQRET